RGNVSLKLKAMMVLFPAAVVRSVPLFLGWRPAMFQGCPEPIGRDNPHLRQNRRWRRAGEAYGTVVIAREDARTCPTGKYVNRFQEKDDGGASRDRLDSTVGSQNVRRNAEYPPERGTNCDPIGTISGLFSLCRRFSRC